VNSGLLFKIGVWLVLMLFYGVNRIHSQTLEEFRKRMYNHAMNMDMVAWQSDLNLMVLHNNKQPSEALLYEIAKARFGLLSYLHYWERKKEMEPHIECLLAESDRLIAMNTNPEYLAMKSSALGLNIYVNPFRGILSAGEAVRLTNMAYKQSPDNPYVMGQYASVRFYAPGWLGGNKGEAERIFKAMYKSLRNSSTYRGDWMRLLIMASYGTALSYDKRFDESVAVYRDILVVEPRFGWVSKKLLPRAELKARAAGQLK